MTSYTVTSPYGVLRVEGIYLDEVINAYARQHLGFVGSVGWASRSSDRDPSIFDGAIEVCIKEERLQGPEFTRTPDGLLGVGLSSVWIFEPKKRFAQILTALGGS